MIKTDQIITIRSAQLEDVDTLCNWWADGEVMAHAGFPKGIKTDKEKLRMDIIKQNEVEHPSSQRMVIEVKDVGLIGETNYRYKGNNVYEIGIKICDFTQHGKGYGEKVIQLLIEYIKKNLHGTKIVLDTNLRNTGAQRFYKRLGFRQVKIEKDCWRDQLGNLQSAVLFEKDL